MQVVINNLLIQYEQQGSGPIALFLHGWGDSSQTFKPLIKELRSSYKCVAVDLPGFGGSQIPTEVWGIKEYAEFVQAFVAKAKLKPDVVFGHSNGGTIALFALSHNLLKPSRLVLLASAGIRSEDNLKKGTYKVVAKAGKQVSRILPKKVQAKLRRGLYNSAGSDIFVSPELEEIFKKVVSYDTQADARVIAQPTLLIYAEDDDATPSRYGTKLSAAIKDSKLEVLPSGGHFLHHTQTASVTKLVEDFLK